MALILDTGPLCASLDRSDADHAACRKLIEGALDHRPFSVLRPRHVRALRLLPRGEIE